LPLHYANSGNFQYSLPSRLSDFLVSGVPVACSCDPDTALHDFIAGIPTLEYSVVHSRRAVRPFRRWFADPSVWVAASAAAARLGRQEMAFRRNQS